MGGSALESGGVALVGANGTVLRRAGADDAFAASVFRNAAGETPALAAVVPGGATGYVLAGDKGVDMFQPKH
jgi:hypothetical protein